MRMASVNLNARHIARVAGISKHVVAGKAAIGSFAATALLADRISPNRGAGGNAYCGTVDRSANSHARAHRDAHPEPSAKTWLERAQGGQWQAAWHSARSGLCRRRHACALESSERPDRNRAGQRRHKQRQYFCCGDACKCPAWPGGGDLQGYDGAWRLTSACSTLSHCSCDRYLAGRPRHPVLPSIPAT